MTLSDKITKDFMVAMKGGSETRDLKNFLGVIRGEIQNAESKPGFDADVTTLAIIKKMEKSLKESVEKGDPISKVELSYLEPYLPQMMSNEQITLELTKIIDSGANNIGFIMGSFNKLHSGKADNKVVKDIATELLIKA